MPTGGAMMEAMDFFERVDDSELREPVLILAIDNWVDAGSACRLANETLREHLSLELIGRFPADDLIDHQLRRPTMRLVDGVISEVTWPDLELFVSRGADRALVSSEDDEPDLLILSGAEPDRHWQYVTEVLLELLEDVGATRVIGLGGYPAAAPHTRPTRIVGTSTDSALALEVGFVPGTLEVPASLGSVIEFEAGRIGIPSVGLWAQVPHYVANRDYVDAAISLLELAGGLAGRKLPLGDLPTRANDVRAELNELVQRNEGHAELVTRFEKMYDEQPTAAELPSGDELADQFEQFLREQPERPDEPGA